MSIKSYFEDLNHQREKQQRKENALKVLSGVAIGSVIGGFTGVLLAPKAGKETRQEIAEKVKVTATAAREKVNETMHDVKEKVEELKDKKIAVVDKTADPTDVVQETYWNREKNWESPKYVR